MAAASLAGVLEEKSWVRRNCREILLETLEQVSRHGENLIKLNPIAEVLFLERQRLMILLTAAVAEGNLPLAAALEVKLQAVIQRQKTLDLQQKVLIRSADLALANVGLRMKKQLPATPLRWFQVIVLPSRPSRIAVRPDRPGIAPTYTPEADFERVQRLEQGWISIVPNQGRMKESCAATISIKKSSWEAHLAEDKSFLKPSL